MWGKRVGGEGMARLTCLAIDKGRGGSSGVEVCGWDGGTHGSPHGPSRPSRPLNARLCAPPPPPPPPISPSTPLLPLSLPSVAHKLKTADAFEEAMRALRPFMDGMVRDCEEWKQV